MRAFVGYSKKHYQDIFDIPSDDLQKLIIEVQKTAKLSKEKLNAEAVNIFQRNGIMAGQVVDHIHFHVVPRYTDDRVKMLPRGIYKGKDFDKVVQLLTS